jgi:hypothetical protein
MVVTCSGDSGRKKKTRKEAKLLRSQEAPCTAIGAYHQLAVILNQVPRTRLVIPKDNHGIPERPVSVRHCFGNVVSSLKGF